MCWDWSDCGKCGKRTYCITKCGCDVDFEEECKCGNRDCKSFNKCETCCNDLCDDCLDKCEKCEYRYCEECEESGKHECE
jgi:hypothetical protein